MKHCTTRPFVFAFLLALIAPAIPLMPTKAAAQASDGRGSSPGETRALNAEIRRLAASVGVRDELIERIAQIIGERLPDLSFDELVSRLQELAQTAGRLQRQVAQLEETLAKLSDPSIRSPALAAVARAQGALNAGELDQADAALAELEWLRRVELEEGLEAWLVSIEARSTLAVASLDPNAPDVAGDARRRYEMQSRLTSLRLANIEASAAFTIALYLSDTNSLAAAIETYRSVALPLALQVTPVEAANVRNNLADALRLRFRYDGDLATLIEVRNHFAANIPIASELPNSEFLANTLVQLGHTDTDIASYHLWSGEPQYQQSTQSALSQARQAYQSVIDTPGLANNDRALRDARIGLGDVFTLQAQSTRNPADIDKAVVAYEQALQSMEDRLTTENYSVFATTSVSMSDALNIHCGMAQDPESCSHSQDNIRIVLQSMDAAERDNVPFQMADRLRAQTVYAEAIVFQTLLTGVDAGLTEAEEILGDVTARTEGVHPQLDEHAKRVLEGLRNIR